MVQGEPRSLVVGINYDEQVPFDVLARLAKLAAIIWLVGLGRDRREDMICDDANR